MKNEVFGYKLSFVYQTHDIKKEEDFFVELTINFHVPLPFSGPI